MPEFPPKLTHFARKGNRHAVEAEDIAIAERIVRRFMWAATLDCRRRQESGELDAEAGWHTEKLIAMQREHIVRVRWNARALINATLWKKCDEEKKLLPWDDALEQRARKIDLALMLHDLYKLDPREPGGVNAERHGDRTAVMAFMIASDVLHKDRAFAQEIMDFAEMALSPLATRKKHTGHGDPGIIDEAIVLAANNLDYVDFWGPRFIVWMRQHPHIKHPPDAHPDIPDESVGDSLGFASRICDAAFEATCTLTLPTAPESVLEPIVLMARQYWKRSRHFFKYVEERAPETFLDFRESCGAFLRTMS